MAIPEGPDAMTGSVVEREDILRTSISEKRRWRLHPLILCVLMMWSLIALMLLVFRASQNDEYTFSGLFGSRFHKWVVYDSMLYLDMIEQSKQGAWLLENRFSPERGEPRYLNSIWTLTGKAAAATGLSSMTVFVLLRFLAVPVFMLALWWFIKEVVTRPATRRLALFLIVFCGGIGWIFGIFARWVPAFRPLYTEGRSPEVSCFLSVLVSPHITLAMGMVLLILTGFILASRGVRWPVYLTPAMVLALSTFHPYDIAMLYGVGGAYVLLVWLNNGAMNRPLAITYLASMAVSAPVLAYHKWALLNAPDMAGLGEQNALPPESSVQYILALSPLLILAGIQLFNRAVNFKSASQGQLMIIAWALALPLLLYAYPVVPFAWKLGIAMPVPVFILAAEWINKKLAADRVERRKDGAQTPSRMVAAIAVIIAVSVLSSVATLSAMTKAAVDRAFPFYLESKDLEAIEWLGEHGGRDDTVLSLRWRGLYVPHMAGMRAFMGHPIQSVDYEGKEEVIESVFQKDELQREDLEAFQRYNINWVFYGFSEQRIWKISQPCDYLTLRFDNSRVRIFEVDRDKLPPYIRESLSAGRGL